MQQENSPEGAPVVRAALLTFFLIALGPGLALPQAFALLGDVEVYRRTVLWGVPLAALVLSLLFQPRLPRLADEGPGSLPRRFVVLGVAALAFAADQSFLGISFWTGWATFTSTQEPDLRQLASTAAWALPACLVLAIWGWERALRGSVYTGWRQILPRAGAIAVSALAGLALSLPSILPGGEMRDPMFVGASLVTAVCREVALVLLFARGGGLLVAGLYRGALVFLEAFLVHDWYSLSYPAYSYVTSGTPFYAVRIASALLALGVVAVLTRRPVPPQTSEPDLGPIRLEVTGPKGPASFSLRCSYPRKEIV